MKSFRLQFIDVDESYTINTTESAIKGFMVVRAPKGTTEAMYFEYGNEKAINAMIGLQTANWPDLYEAIAFNNEYGLYISAPPGTSKEYPSYYGGVYLTTSGLHNYWRVDDKDNPSFEIKVDFTNEDADYGEDIGASEIGIQLPTTAGAQGTVVVSDISTSLLAKTSYFNLKTWTDDGVSTKEGEETSFHIVGDAVHAVINDEDSYLISGLFTDGTDGTKVLTLGNADGIDNAYNSKAVPYFDFEKLMGIDFGSFKAASGDDEELDFTLVKSPGHESIGLTLMRDLIINGVTSNTILYPDGNLSSDVKIPVKPFEGLASRLFWRTNIKNETFMRISQKSPNEVPTLITIEDIGYDKYAYDLCTAYVSEEAFNERKNDSSFISLVGASNTDFVLSLIKDGVSNEDWAFGPSDVLRVVKYDATTKTWEDISSTLKTKTVYMSRALLGIKDTGILDIGKAYLNHAIFEVVSTGNTDEFRNTCYKQTEDGTYQLQQDIRYNTITLSCKEEVYPGSYTTGGDFTGSLNEKGVDAAGSNIYWPNVLPEDSVSFIEVVPVNTFDDLGILDLGFWPHERIVDVVGPDIDIYSFSIAGDRFASYVNEKNVKAGTLGCAWRNEYEAIIKDGLIEAQAVKYDDAMVIMEPTGQEVFKPSLMALRTTFQNLSTVISPKIITKAEFLNPDTIVVSGRSTGTAQYIGEFKMYDSYTGKYYWCQPIGDVGVMLARIMDKKLGGMAPAGTNDSQNLGGVLSRPVLEAKWDWTDSGLEVCTNKGLNAITFDADNGLMMQDHRTTQDPKNVTDWSYLGHSMSFDLCKREIRDKVMTPQIHKRISEHWMDIREAQTLDILDKRITGKDPIWAEATVDIKGVNNEKTMAQRKFYITVKVKVYVYSDYVILKFVNRAQM